MRVATALRSIEQRIERLTGPRLATAFLIGLALAGLFIRLGAAPVAMHSEERCLEVAQHMVDSGDWLVPVLDGQIRFQKPPLYYWAAALGAGSDGVISPFALRVPAALAALGLAGVVFAWGVALGGRRTGLLAVATLLATSQYWVLGRRGVAEMPLTLASMLGLYAFSRVYWDRIDSFRPVLLGALVVGFMAKATTALMLIGLPVLLQLAYDRSLRSLLRRRQLIAAGGVVVLCASWYVALLLTEPAAMAAFKEALLLPLGLAHSTGSTTHYRPPWYYPPLMLLVASPALLLVPLIVDRIRDRGALLKDPRVRFVAIALVSLCLAFSAIPMKQKHYLLPLLPLFAVLAGHAASQILDSAGSNREKWIRYFGVVLLICGPPVALAVGGHLWLVGSPGLASGAVCVVLLAAGLGFVASRHQCWRLVTVAALIPMLIFFATKEFSLTVWCGHFKNGTPERMQGFRAERWEHAFAVVPALRIVYEAREWYP